MIKQVSVIIPCHNHGRYITPIVNEIQKSKYTGEIIVVNDGSSSGTTKILSTLKNIKLISHSKNLGKSQAMKTGLLASKYPVIVYVDSDLIGLKKSHIDQLVKPIFTKNFDMVIGEVSGLLFFFKLIGYSVAYSGQRAIKKDLLLKHLDIFYPNGYIQGFMVEPNINNYFFGKYKVGQSLLNGVGQDYKIAKVGLKGLINDWKIMSSVAKHLGLKKHIHQLQYSKKLPQV